MTALSTSEFGGVPDSVQADAEWFEENGSEYWKVLYRLRDWCKQNGPVELADGKRVGLFADGVDYDTDAIAELVPALVSRMAVTFDGTVPEIERTLSLVVEEIPGLEFSIKKTIDKPALTGMIRQGGPMADQLAACKTAKSKLSIR
jgi:hypothetical protein